MDIQDNNYTIFWDDFKKAEIEELDNIDIIKQVLNIDTIEKDKDRFSVYDFKTDNFYIEFRRRYCNLNKYPTTMIPKSKIDFSNKTEKPCYIFIKFNDCITLWKVPKNLNPKWKKGGRLDRGENEYRYKKQYYYLDIKELDVFEIVEE